MLISNYMLPESKFVTCILRPCGERYGTLRIVLLKLLSGFLENSVVVTEKCSENLRR